MFDHTSSKDNAAKVSDKMLQSILPASTFKRVFEYEWFKPINFLGLSLVVWLRSFNFRRPGSNGLSVTFWKLEIPSDLSGAEIKTIA